MQAKIDAQMSGHWLYDPPVDGPDGQRATPLNGSGLPSKSHIIGDVEKKLAQGFTREAVGVEGPAIPDEIPEKLERVGSIADATKASITRADLHAKK